MLAQIKAQGISDGTLTNEDPTFYDVVDGKAVLVTGDQYSNYVTGQQRVGYQRKS